MPTAEMQEDRPKRGDRVKLISPHHDAGQTGVYFTDRENYQNGQSFPWVKLDFDGREVPVANLDWMRKI